MKAVDKICAYRHGVKRSEPSAKGKGEESIARPFPLESLESYSELAGR